MTTVNFMKTNSKWIKDSEPKDQDGSIGEYYFDKHYWKSNKDGMWKFETPKPPEPPIEEDMSLKKIEEYAKEVEKYGRWIEIETDKARAILNTIDSYSEEQRKYARWIQIEVDKLQSP